MTDGALGNVKQCLALCHYLQEEPICYSEKAPRPWRWLGPRGVLGGTRALPDKVRQAIALQQPELLVSAGRQGALFSRVLQSCWNPSPTRIHILNPRISPAHFDLVITPQHDQLAGPNVIETVGSLNNVDDESLQRARSQWSDRLGSLPRPVQVILIGGSTRTYRITPAAVAAIASSARQHREQHGGSVLVSMAPRSTPDIHASVETHLASLASDMWAGEPDNPYLGYLAYADRILVTPDSINMVSEACAVGVPVVVDFENVTHARFARFYATLASRGLISSGSVSSADLSDKPLRETEKVAAEVRRRLTQVKKSRR